MLWRDRPISWRASRLKELDFGVGLRSWPAWDVVAMARTGASFMIMNGDLKGRRVDKEGAVQLLASARETAPVGKRLGVHGLCRSGRHGSLCIG